MENNNLVNIVFFLIFSLGVLVGSVITALIIL